jgi:hypothetical protein
VIFRQQPPAHQRPATSAAPRRAWFPHVARQQRKIGPAPDRHPRCDAPEPARRACRQRTRGPAQRGPVPGSGPDRQRATGLLVNAATVTGGKGSPGGPGGDQAARVTGPDETGICPGDRLANAGSAPGSGVLPADPRRRRCPIRTHVRRPKWPPLLYFAAVLAVRFVRIRLLTSGAKRARTADLLHAIWRQHVHPRPSLQVTVLPRPPASGCVRTSCGTFLLYSAPPSFGSGSGPADPPQGP